MRELLGQTGTTNILDNQIGNLKGALRRVEGCVLYTLPGMEYPHQILVALVWLHWLLATYLNTNTIHFLQCIINL